MSKQRNSIWKAHEGVVLLHIRNSKLPVSGSHVMPPCLAWNVVICEGRRRCHVAVGIVMQGRVGHFHSGVATTSPPILAAAYLPRLSHGEATGSQHVMIRSWKERQPVWSCSLNLPWLRRTKGPPTLPMVCSSSSSSSIGRQLGSISLDCTFFWT